jgi:hypothetical protein
LRLPVFGRRQFSWVFLLLAVVAIHLLATFPLLRLCYLYRRSCISILPGY